MRFTMKTPTFATLLSSCLVLSVCGSSAAFGQISEPNIKGILTVHQMTQGQLLWLKGRVGDGYYVGLNGQGQSCSLTVPVAIGQYSEDSRLGIKHVGGVKIAITSQKLSNAILNGQPIRSDEWNVTQTDQGVGVDGYIINGISLEEGFALNAKRRWVSWLLDEKAEPDCQ